MRQSLNMIDNIHIGLSMQFPGSPQIYAWI
jgi:hypothetical protein